MTSYSLHQVIQLDHLTSNEVKSETIYFQGTKVNVLQVKGKKLHRSQQSTTLGWSSTSGYPSVLKFETVVPKPSKRSSNSKHSSTVQDCLITKFRPFIAVARSQLIYGTFTAVVRSQHTSQRIAATFMRPLCGALKIPCVLQNEEILMVLKLPSTKEAASILSSNLHQSIVNHSNSSILSLARNQDPHRCLRAFYLLE